MVKYLSIALISVVLLACTEQTSNQTQTKVDTTSTNKTQALPLLHIQPEVYELGDIQEGEAAIATFIIRNNSQNTIELVDIQASCGCTAAEPDSYVLMPGAFTQLKVAVDTTAKQDGIIKSVHIKDSMGNQASATLNFNVVENPHLKTSQVMGIFDGKCASCHFEPLVSVNEPSKLYEVGCAMCHGENGEGAYAPSLLGQTSLAALKHSIAHGTGKRQMPGFSEMNDGPLTYQQIESLAVWLMALPEN